LTAGAADVAFLAIEPERAAEVSFTPAYVIVEGVYAVPLGSPITTASEVDRPGVRVGVKEGSAYDLFLSRTLTHAEVVRGSDGIDVFSDRELEVAAGIRQPLSRYVASHPGIRLVEPRFMQIRQAIATTKNRTERARAFLHEFVETVKANGFVADALARSGQDATVAPPT
jgi:polar amino acid transport system substrate-binding protein